MEQSLKRIEEDDLSDDATPAGVVCVAHMTEAELRRAKELWTARLALEPMTFKDMLWLGGDTEEGASRDGRRA